MGLGFYDSPVISLAHNFVEKKNGRSQDVKVGLKQRINFIRNDFHFSCSYVQCPPLKRITLGQHKSDSNNRMVQSTSVFYKYL